MRNSVPFKSYIPNFITTLNLFLGCIAVVFAFQDQIILAAMSIFIAGVMDFLDGVAARLLHAYSEIGKMLDSLADMVSFGVAPSAILYQLLSQSVLTADGITTGKLLGPNDSLVPCVAFVLAVFSALRLAKFNIDERQTNSFIGLPTPASAFLVASLPFILQKYEFARHLVLNIYLLIPFILIVSVLLVSEIPMISLKFKNLNFTDNKSRFLLLLSSLILFIFLQISAFPFIFVLYLLLSVIDNPQKIHSTK